MKTTMIAIQLLIVFLISSSFQYGEEKTYQIRVTVEDLRNSTGTVQFALYNNGDIFPDEQYKNYFRMQTASIVNGSSEITFLNLPAGKYAVNILHDEDSNGKIKKGLILPKEGIGFSNYQSIGISNKPKFEKAHFTLNGDKEVNVKIIYF